jgi:ABC-2 type transport system permease protein
MNPADAPARPPQGLSFEDSLRAYGALVARSLRAAFAYRSSTVQSFLTAVLTFYIVWVVWAQVYTGVPQPGAAPREQLFAYLTLAFCLNYSLTMNGEFRVAQRIRMGLIATDLLKPLDFQWMQLAQSLSDFCFNASIGLLSFFLAWGILGQSLAPSSFESLALFLPSFVLGFLIHFAVMFLFVQGIFFTTNNYGISVARGALHMTFSGLSAPLHMYPQALQIVGHFLPFQHVLYTPIRVYQGTLCGEEALWAIGRQAIWAFGLLLIGRMLFRRIVQSLEVQGG